jgi:hypothetical protein
MRCPACHEPGIEVDSTGALTPLFACQMPECMVQTFDAQGAQSIEAPETSPQAGALQDP